jgi:hypothetical protein
MVKHTSKEAFFERMKELAEVNKTSVKETKTRNLGTLIDYKRAADGVAYGIIKEQHHYFVKKGGLKKDPDVSDFAYIGGLSNITNFEYPSLAVADKQRNMILHDINEATSLRPDKNGSKKKRLNEDKAGEEIEKASSKVGDLETATSAEAAPEMPVDTEVPIEAKPEGDAEASAEVPPEETPAPEDGEEEIPAPEGGEEEAPTEEPEGDEEAPEGTEVTPEDEKSLTIKEIEKSLGKVTNKIRNTELTDAQVKSYVNSFLSAFKDKFDEVEIEDRKAMADKILKVVPEKDVEDLGASVEATGGEEEVEEDICTECGGFGKYAESRGYTKESLMECGEEELGNVVSGYANAFNDGQNDGDFKMVALLVTPEMLGKLKDDYGHDDYAEKLTPYVNQLGECELEEKQAQIDELWGGLKGAFKKVGGDVKAGAQKVGQAVAGAAQKAGQAVGQYATGVKQAYHTAEVPGEIKKLEGVAADLGKQIAALNTRLQKAGQQPVNVNGILQSIANQVGVGGTASLSKFGVAAEGVVDMGNVEVQPPLTEIVVPEKKGKKLSATGVKVGVLKEDDEPEAGETEEHEEGETPEEEKAEYEGDTEKNVFGTGEQNLGVGIVKPEGAGVEIRVTPDKTVNIQMNEKWDKDVKIKSTGEHAGKTVAEIDKELSNLKKRSQTYQDKGEKVPEDIKEKEHELNFAKRAKTGWKENESVKMSESEKKLRKYIRERLEIKAGLRKAKLTESKKSATLQKLDKVIDEQFKLYEGVVLKKGVNKGQVNEVFGLSVADKFPKLDPNDAENVNKLFRTAYNDILINPMMSRIGDVASRATTAEKYDLIKKYVEGNGGTLRIGENGRLVYMTKQFQNTGIKSPMSGGGTQGKTQFGGAE